MNNDPFKEYIKESEPDKRDKGYAWHTAIGLQAVDGLKTSEYLVHTAVRNIEGEISFEEVNALLQSYYESIPMPDVLGNNITRKEWVLSGTLTAPEKVNIENPKVNIEREKVNIENL